MPFLVREAIQLRLNKRVVDVENGYRQNVGILGPSGVGKTKLLCEFFQSISRNPKLIPVYVKAETIDGRQLMQQWMGSVLSAVLLDRTLNIPKTLNGLLREAESVIPKTAIAVKHLQRLIRQDKNASAVRELFMLSGTLARETGKKVILMIDEFQSLEKLPTPDPFLLLGKQMMLDKEVLYLVTSSATDRAREIFREKLSLLFGNFEVLELAPFGFMEMEQYLATRMPAHRWPVELKKFLFHMTDGEPIYLDLLIDRLETYEVREFPQDVSPAVLLDVFCQELFDRRGRIALLFEKRIDQCAHLAKQSGPYIRAMLALSHNRHKLIPIAAFIEETVAETQKVLKRLVQEGLIVKSGSFHCIPDFLFRFWVREVFQKRHDLFLPEERILRKRLFDELNRVLDLCARMTDEDLGLRFEALLKEFRNDVLEIDQKKIQCPQFSETVLLRHMPHSMFSLAARGARGRWAFYLSSEWIGESEIEMVVADAKRLRNVQRKVLISLDGMDPNARLIAQEAKMQLWDLRYLNALLDLYDLPKVILSPNRGIHEPEEIHEPSVGSVAQDLSALESR
ncbi:MAG TPA: ATP-binding protein [Candidatus Omnitrophota bacterium]|nr:ATP-binding protein [Candidatus Omnitrophota bacterium]HPS36767.1 ATP-binding protein [Candidatus Omnitrophota bacterium]